MSLHLDPKARELVLAFGAGAAAALAISAVLDSLVPTALRAGSAGTGGSGASAGTGGIGAACAAAAATCTQHTQSSFATEPLTSFLDDR